MSASRYSLWTALICPLSVCWRLRRTGDESARQVLSLRSAALRCAACRVMRQKPVPALLEGVNSTGISSSWFRVVTPLSAMCVLNRC